VPSIRKDRFDTDNLKSVAIYQKGILVCLLVILLVFLVGLLVPRERILLGVMSLVYLTASITATVFVFLLATKVYSPGLGILLGFLAFIPCLGLLVLLRINGKATSILRAHGFRVGLMGANLSDFR
jgi:hypothetical protein